MLTVIKGLLSLAMVASLVLSPSWVGAHAVSCHHPDSCREGVLVDCHDFDPCAACPGHDEDEAGAVHQPAEGHDDPATPQDPCQHHHQCLCHGFSVWLVASAGDPLPEAPVGRRLVLRGIDRSPPDSPVFLFDRPPIA